MTQSLRLAVWPMRPTFARAYQYAGILVLASVGAFRVNRSVFYVGLLYMIGGAGYAMRRYEVPLAGRFLYSPDRCRLLALAVAAVASST